MPNADRLQQELSDIAHRFGADALLAEIATPPEPAPPTLAVVGEFSTGKSTLVNFLLRADLMPVADRPTTQFPVEVRHSDDRSYALVPSADGEEQPPEAVGADEFAAASSPSATPGAYTRGEVGVPSSFLANGLVLVDTPGVSSAAEVHEDVTFGYLPHADAILVVLDATRGVAASLQEFLRTRVLAEDVSRLVFVVNRLAEIPPGRRDDTLATIERALVDTVAAPAILPLTLPAADATAFEGLPADRRRAHGLDAIEQALLRLLVDRREEVLATRESRRLRALAGRLRAHLVAYADALSAPSDDAIRHEIEDHKVALDTLRQRLRAAKDDLRADTRATADGLRSSLDARLATVRVQAQAMVHDEIDNPGRGGGVDERLAGVQRDSFSARLNAAVRAAVSEFGVRDLAPAAERLQGRWSENVQDAIDVRHVASEVTIDVEQSHRRSRLLEGAVDIGLVVALDLILPGGLAVAILGRIGGQKILTETRERIVGAIERVLLDGVLSRGVEAAVMAHVDTQLAALADGVMGRVRAALDDLGDRLIAEVERQTDADAAQRRELLEEARRRRADGASSADDERAAALAAIGTLDDVAVPRPLATS